MLTDYGRPHRQRLIHPNRLRKVWEFLTSIEPDMGMPEPDTGHAIAVARCTGDAKLLDMPPPRCDCGAFEWPHARGISTKCTMRPRRLLRVVVAPEIDQLETAQWTAYQ